MYAGLNNKRGVNGRRTAGRAVALVLLAGLRIGQPLAVAQQPPTPTKALGLAPKSKPKLPVVVKNLQKISHKRALLKLHSDKVGIAAVGEKQLPHVTTLKPLAPRQIQAAAVAGDRTAWFVADLDGTVGIQEALTKLSGHPDVLAVEPDQIMSLPKPVAAQGKGTVSSHEGGSDQYLFEQYALERIQAFDAWSYASGSRNVVVAVVDSGTQLDHPDLSENIWQNPYEEFNGYDDDGNGYVDDVYGFDFVNNDNDPFDDNGHGTHVAGIIAAIRGNGLGVAGVANVSIMPVKVVGADGIGDMSVIMAGVEYAIQQGAHIINMSLGGGDYSQAFDDVCRQALTQNVLIFAASGNEGAGAIGYPSAYDSVIAVGATDANDQVADFSNIGQGIELVAPGVQVLSTYINSDYSYLDGTSMACPYAVGVAALLRSARPSWSAEELRSLLSGTADDLGASGYDTVSGYGRINAYRALTESPGYVPPPVAGATTPINDTFSDDAFEPNNDAGLAANVTSGSYQLEGWDADWFAISIPTSGELTASISGTQGDLDLFIFDAYGSSPLAESVEVGSVETASVLVSGGVYYIVVNPYENQGSSYSLNVNAPVGSSPQPQPEPEPISEPVMVAPMPAACGAGVMQAGLIGLFGFLAMGTGRGRFGYRG